MPYEFDITQPANRPADEEPAGKKSPGEPAGELERALFSGEQATRLAAVTHIASLAPADAEQLLKRVMSHWDRRFRIACARALAVKQGDTAAPILINAANTGRLPRKLVLKLLSRSDNGASAQFLAGYLHSTSLSLAAIALQSLRELTCDEATFFLWEFDGVLKPELVNRLDGIPLEKLRRFISWLDSADKLRLLDEKANRNYLERRGLGDVYRETGISEEEARSLRIGNAFKTGDIVLLNDYPAEELEAFYRGLDESAQGRLLRNKRLKNYLHTRAITGHRYYESFGQRLVAETAAATGVNSRLLGWVCGNWDTLDSFYSERRIPKKQGGFRTISAPAGILKAAQRGVYEGLLARTELQPACHGFRREYSTITNARDHVGKKIVLTIDLEDFFPSISAGRVYGIFRSLGMENHVARFLTRLTTHNERLPQGAPTSPALANLVCRRLDSRLTGLARRLGAAYTRYADDLSFSGEHEIIRTMPLIRQIIGEEGFRVSEKKVRITRRGNRQEVTGLTVNTRVAVPRRERKKLRAALHRLHHGKKAVWNGHEAGPDVIQGMIAYVASVHPALSARYNTQLNEIRRGRNGG